MKKHKYDDEWKIAKKDNKKEMKKLMNVSMSHCIWAKKSGRVKTRPVLIKNH
jgi:hypothetical protein